MCCGGASRPETSMLSVGDTFTTDIAPRPPWWRRVLERFGILTPRPATRRTFKVISVIDA